MKEKTVHRIMDQYIEEFDKLTNDQLNIFASFNLINKIVSQYEKEEVCTVMSINYHNGNALSGLCFVTEFNPGGILFQSEDDFAPKVNVIYPEEMEEFLEQYGPILFPEYPEIPDEE